MSHAVCIVGLDPSEIEDHGSVENAVAYQMMPFDENGEWFRDGTRWDWFEIGGRYQGRLLGSNVAKRAALTPDALAACAAQRAHNLWENWLAEERKTDFVREHVYGLAADESLSSLIAKFQANRISGYAFLRHRRWHENGRMGWWGSTVKTECEISHGHEGVCLHKNEALGAQIVSYNHDEDGWRLRYFDRFIAPLDPETVLVTVDYHV